MNFFILTLLTLVTSLANFPDVSDIKPTDFFSKLTIVNPSVLSRPQDIRTAQLDFSFRINQYKEGESLLLTLPFVFRHKFPGGAIHIGSGDVKYFTCTFTDAGYKFLDAYLDCYATSNFKSTNPETTVSGTLSFDFTFNVGGSIYPSDIAAAKNPRLSSNSLSVDWSGLKAVVSVTPGPFFDAVDSNGELIFYSRFTPAAEEQLYFLTGTCPTGIASGVLTLTTDNAFACSRFTLSQTNQLNDFYLPKSFQDVSGKVVNCASDSVTVSFGAVPIGYRVFLTTIQAYRINSVKHLYSYQLKCNDGSTVQKTRIQTLILVDGGWEIIDNEDPLVSSTIPPISSTSSTPETLKSSTVSSATDVPSSTLPITSDGPCEPCTEVISSSTVLSFIPEPSVESSTAHLSSTVESSTAVVSSSSHSSEPCESCTEVISGSTAVSSSAESSFESSTVSSSSTIKSSTPGVSIESSTGVVSSTVESSSLASSTEALSSLTQTFESPSDSSTVSRITPEPSSSSAISSTDAISSTAGISSSSTSNDVSISSSASLLVPSFSSSYPAVSSSDCEVESSSSVNVITVTESDKPTETSPRPSDSTVRESTSQVVSSSGVLHSRVLSDASSSPSSDTQVTPISSTLTAGSTSDIRVSSVVSIASSTAITSSTSAISSNSSSVTSSEVASITSSVVSSNVCVFCTSVPSTEITPSSYDVLSSSSTPITSNVSSRTVLSTSEVNEILSSELLTPIPSSASFTSNGTPESKSDNSNVDTPKRFGTTAIRPAYTSISTTTAIHTNILISTISTQIRTQNSNEPVIDSTTSPAISDTRATVRTTQSAVESTPQENTSPAASFAATDSTEIAIIPTKLVFSSVDFTSIISRPLVTDSRSESLRFTPTTITKNLTTNPTIPTTPPIAPPVTSTAPPTPSPTSPNTITHQGIAFSLQPSIFLSLLPLYLVLI